MFCSSSCRFCLRLLEEDEKQITVNRFIRNQFFVITQIELNVSEAYSQIICETCFDSTRNFAAFKLQLIENQQKLESVQPPEVPNDENALTLTAEDLVDVKIEKLANYDGESCSAKVQLDWSDNEESLKHASEEAPSNHLKGSTRAKNIKKKMCDICGTWFSAMAFKRHYERIHLKRRDFCCDLCGYKAFKKFDLNNHIKSHLKVSSCHLV